MKINKAKASNYDRVMTKCIVDYIVDYARKSKTIIDDNNDKLRTCDRTQLKAIASELETICKRLDYILEGRY